ncbi:MAG TPA: hypothetical protein VFW69_10635 [Mycobacterium sp.]|nr:hypothetical protein [Mycobacterium sp.]
MLLLLLLLLISSSPLTLSKSALAHVRAGIAEYARHEGAGSREAFRKTYNP